ncbi:MAG: O-antigen ligase family protein [Bacteroidia bacterium]
MQQIRKYFGNTTETLLLISLLYTVAVMPFQKQGVPVWPGIALLTAVCLFTGNLKNKLLAFLSNGNAVIFAALYLFYCCGYFYSSNTAYALTDLLLKIPLVIFPFVFSALPLKEKSALVLKSFLVVSLLSAVICLIRAAYQTHVTGENYFSYIHLSYFIHVGHYAMYLVFAVCISVHFFFREQQPIMKWFYGFSFVILVITIVLLSARAQLVALLFIACSGIVFFFFSQKKWLQGFAVLGITLLFCVSALYFVTGLRTRILSVKNESTAFLSGDNKSYNGISARFMIWDAAWEVIKENPLAGVGTGDAKDKLMEEAEKKDYVRVVKQNLNYHNQYLQTWAAIGLPGLSALVCSIIIGISYSLKRKNFLITAFFINILISFFTEAVLERQTGVIFYSFFSAILIFADNE